MTRLRAVLDARADRAALVTYFCAGDPDAETTERAALAALQAGADILEIGVPFSDPSADGPVIQRASARALRGGMTLADTLSLVERLRARSDAPIVLFGYYNPIFAYGERALCQRARAAGVDALLVVDLPADEGESLREHAAESGLSIIPLLAPSSSPARVALAAAHCDSFVYYVSTSGVTGAASADFQLAATRARALRQETGAKVVVGFGVSSRADVAKLAEHADGVVVGSALVRAIEQAKDREAAVEAVRRLVAELASGLTRAPRDQAAQL